MGKARTYSGEAIAVTFDMDRCIHARNCILKLPNVFDSDRKPWIDPDAAPAEEIAAMIRTCPSGALTFERLDGGLEEQPPGINRAAIQENGPIAFHGNLAVSGERMTRATICRCGKSGNMPFCDNSHIDAGFKATGEPEASEKEAEPENPGDLLEIIPQENGPNEARGPLEITTGTGHRVHRGKRSFMCRCGHSSNKPFCDGSHKDAGFEAPGASGD